MEFSGLLGKGKKKTSLQIPGAGEEKPTPKPEETGTTLRKQEEAPTPSQKNTGPELTTLEISKEKEWEVKTLPI